MSLIRKGHGYLTVVLYTIQNQENYMQGSSYVGNIIVESMLFSMVLTQSLNNNSGMQRYFDLEILTKYQYLTGYYKFDSQRRSFDTIIDVDYWYTCIHLHINPEVVKFCSLHVVFNFESRIGRAYNTFPFQLD